MPHANACLDAFQGTARYYARYRPGVPCEVVEYVRQRFDLDGKSTLLDMGCGTGLSTVAFAPMFARTVAFDTSSEMLDEARASQPPSLTIDWQLRSDRDITGSEGSYRLAIACRSFHWMDQYPLLDRLHRVLEPGGGVVLMSDGSFWSGDDPWQTSVREVIQSFLGEDRRAGEKRYAAPNEPYREMLEKAGYLDVQGKDVEVRRTWDVDHIIGYLYSTSFSKRSLYGDRSGEFETTLRDALLALSGGRDEFVEHAHFVVNTGTQA